MLTYSTTEARKNFSEIVNQVKYKKQVVALGRNNRIEAFIVPNAEYSEDVNISAINAHSPSFSFLENEPDLYSLADLKKRYA